MPVIDVTVVRDDGFVLPQGAASELANGLARVFEAPEGKVWVRLHHHPAAAYAENGSYLRAMMDRPS